MKTKAKKVGPARWRSRIVGHEKMNPLALVANPRNYKAHPVNQRKALLMAIDDVGFVRSITVNKQTGTIIDGHLRVALAIQEKQAAVDVELVELSPREEIRVLASMDPIGGLAEVDGKKLDALLADLAGSDTDVLKRAMDASGPVAKKRKPAANTQASIGAYRFEIKRGVYERWVEALRKAAGFEEELIIAEIKKRLRLK